MACVRDALNRIKDVTVEREIDDVRNGRTIQVAVVDSLARQGRWYLSVLVVSRPDAASVLQARYYWIGTASSVAADEQQARVCNW